MQRHLLEPLRDLEEGIVAAHGLQHPVGGVLDDLGPRVEVAIHPVAEAHQPEVAVLLLGHGHVLGHVAAIRRDLVQHLHHCLVRAAMQRAPQGVHPGADRGEQVGVAGADHAHRRGGAVLLVVGVQYQQQVERIGDHRVDLVRLGRHAEHHVQEVRRVAQRIGRVDVRLPDALLVGPGRDGRHLGQQPMDADLDVLRVERIVAVLVEGRQGARARRHDRHRVRVLREAVKEAAHLLVDQGVPRDAAHERLERGRCGQVTIDQQIGHLDEGALGGQLLDRIAAVAQDPGIAIEVGDGAGARSGVAEAVVERHDARLRPQLTDIDPQVAIGPPNERQLDRAAVDGQRGRVSGSRRLVHHQISSFTASRSSRSSACVASSLPCAHGLWAIPGSISTRPRATARSG